MKKKILFIMNPISGTASKAAVPEIGFMMKSIFFFII